jgi:hypothetical protein
MCRTCTDAEVQDLQRCRVQRPERRERMWLARYVVQGLAKMYYTQDWCTDAMQGWMTCIDVECSRGARLVQMESGGHAQMYNVQDLQADPYL